MNKRYGSTNDKFKELNRDGINIQIFNITARNRKNIHSTGRRSNFEHFEEQVKRGGSMFYRKSNNDRNQNQNSDNKVVPIVPNYEHATSALKDFSKENILKKQEQVSTSMHNLKYTEEEDCNMEEVHYSFVLYQQKMKEMARLL